MKEACLAVCHSTGTRDVHEAPLSFCFLGTSGHSDAPGYLLLAGIFVDLETSFCLGEATPWGSKPGGFMDATELQGACSQQGTGLLTGGGSGIQSCSSLGIWGRASFLDVVSTAIQVAVKLDLMGSS